MKKRVLVAGGAGFIGSHLCEVLLENNCTVCCIDNLYTGRMENIRHLISNPDFEFINHDVIYPFEKEVDQIFNLASPASPVYYQIDPVRTWKTNTIGSMNMLELARKNKARIFQSSTSEVYGDPDIHPQPEEYRGNVNPIGLRACYDEGKRAAETLFFDYHRMYGIEIKVVRIFNTYGPRMFPEDGRVISNFIIEALRDRPLKVYGDGSQTRSFCFVDDMIRGFMKMMNSPATITGPINLGNPCELTIFQVAELIIDMCNSNSTIDFRELPEDDPRKRKPDITKAKTLLGWQPEVDFEKGLMKAINYFDNLLAGERKEKEPVENVLLINDPCLKNNLKINEFDTIQKNYI
ncbi:MAG: SDR family oxidoreductase [Spirochaetales bacterium]|nr:SDR family oxidoreductase [Spirochaetales bacterium]